MSAEVHRPIRAEMDVSRTALESSLYCRNAGLSESASQMVATAVSELARNILKYAGSGEIRLRPARGMGVRGVEIEAIDQGPGIADCEAAMKDHFSSGGTLGLGLPGVQRLMDEFSLESTPGEGTRVRARKWI